ARGPRSGNTCIWHGMARLAGVYGTAASGPPGSRAEKAQDAIEEACFVPDLLLRGGPVVEGLLAALLEVGLALGEDRRDPTVQLRVRAEDVAERLVIDDEEDGVGQASHRGSAPLARHERHLAEEVAGPEDGHPPRLGRAGGGHQHL